MAILVLLSSVSAVFADNVKNNVSAGGSNTFTLGGSTTIGYEIQATGGDGQNGCNASDGSAATVTVIKPSAVSVTPASRLYTSCGSLQSFTFSASAAGEYSITVSVSDSGPGTYNTSQAAFTLKVLTPNTRPIVSVTGVTDGGSYEHGSVPTATCVVSDDNDNPDPFPAQLGAITGSLAGYGLGSRTATCNYRDSGGLDAVPASATFSIIDTTKPIISGTPSNQDLEATSAAGAAATWAAPTANDAVSGSAAVDCLPASGSTFDLTGSPHTVKCSATDAAGNTASASFTVSVNDTSAPDFSSVPGNQTLEATSSAGAIATWTGPTATDAVDGGVAVSCVPGSGSLLALQADAHTVTCSASDSRGNDASTGFTIAVQDTMAPVISGTPADKAVEATSAAGAVVTWAAPTASDAVDGATSVACLPASGSTFGLGTTTVTCSASDSRGNESQTTFDVTVEDTTGPVIHGTPGNRTIEATGANGASLSWSASANDAVDGARPVDCLPASGSTFGLGDTLVTCSSSDRSNNISQVTFTLVVVDTTAPSTAITGPSGWIRTNSASFELSGSDLVTSASDLVYSYKLDGGAWSAFSSSTRVDLTDLGEGEHILYARARDQAGNVVAAAAAASRKFKVDTVDPTVVLGDQNRTTWSNSAVAHTFQASDNGSGLRSDQGLTAGDEFTLTIVDESKKDANGNVVPTTVSKTTWDVAGNATERKLSALIDRTDPVLNVSGAPTGTTYELCSASVLQRPTFAPADGLSGLDGSQGDSWTSNAKASGVGTYTYTANARDEAGNDDSETRTYKVRYGSAYSKALQPINTDGSSRFKMGSTVPVKFALTCNGTPVTNAVAHLSVKNIDKTPDAGVDEAFLTTTGTGGNQFRYSDGQYIFNLSTKSAHTNADGTTTVLGQGTWYLWISLDDGTTHSVKIQLVK